MTFAACGRTKSVVFPVLVLQITLVEEVERRLAALDRLRAVGAPLNNGLRWLWQAGVGFRVTTPSTYCFSVTGPVHKLTTARFFF